MAQSNLPVKSDRAPSNLPVKSIEEYVSSYTINNDGHSYSTSNPNKKSSSDGDSNKGTTTTSLTLSPQATIALNKLRQRLR